MEREIGFKNILLATDGTAPAEAAVDATISLARYSPTTVRVLNVWEVEPQSGAEHLVQDTVDRLTRAGVMAEKEVFRAAPDLVPDAIAATARQMGADLVVIGSRGLSSWQSILHRSISHHVMAAVDCPVLVIRDPMHGSFAYERRVMVAVAGGDDVMPAVKAALALARPVPATVLVVHAAQAMFGPQGFAYIEAEEEINATLEGACKPLRDAGIAVETTVLRSGPVADGLAEIAAGWDADVIITGSGRMGEVASLLLGSVSHELLHKSDVPVLISERLRS